MPSFFEVPNLNRWQHYKDRCPPWIKLHRDIFNDYDFSILTDTAKLHLILIWLLASQMDNCIPFDEKWVKNRIGVSESVDLNSLVEHGFIVMLAS